MTTGTIELVKIAEKMSWITVLTSNFLGKKVANAKLEYQRVPGETLSL